MPIANIQVILGVDTKISTDYIFYFSVAKKPEN